MQDRIKSLQTIKITAIEGCVCAPSVAWFNCPCLAYAYDYFVLPLNWEEVLADGDQPDPCPAVSEVAEVINLHPTAKFLYMGSREKIYGGEGEWGATLHQRAVAMAQKLRESAA